MDNNLRKLRLEKNKSQEQMAKIANVSQSNYSKYEIGKTQMPYTVIQTLSKYFNVSIDYLLGNETITRDMVDIPAQLPYPLDIINATIRENGESSLSERELDELINYIRFIKSKRQQFVPHASERATETITVYSRSENNDVPPVTKQVTKEEYDEIIAFLESHKKTD